MQYTCIKNNKIENVIVCEPEVLNTLDLPYDSFLDYEMWHEIGVSVVDGEFFKYTYDEDGTITETQKFNIETEIWEIV